MNISDIETIIKDVYKNKEITIIVIDGPSGSGKTTLAKKLSENTDTTVFSIDDYFLPKDKKTPERLSIPGGNVDYERFKSEIIDNLVVGKTITYQRYDCHREIYHTIETTIKPLVIIEGVYSAHPYFNKYYDLLIYLDINFEKQQERIKKRNGTKGLKRFIHEWIPLENQYFNYYQIKEKANLVIPID